MIQCKSRASDSLLRSVWDNWLNRFNLVVLGGVSIGLVVAGFVIISPMAGLTLLISGTVLTFTVLLRKPNYLLFAWVIITPFFWLLAARWFPQYFHYIGRTMFWGGLACVMIAWAIDNILNKRQLVCLENVPLPLKVTIMIFLLWGMISILRSQEAFLGIRKLSHIVIGFVATYILYDVFSRDENNIRRLLRVISLLVIVISFAALFKAVEGLIHGVPIYKQISLVFRNPNSLGTFLSICLPIIIVTGFGTSGKLGMKICLATIILLALFFSFHRTSWLSSSVALIFLILKSRVKVPVWFTVVVGLFVSALLSPLVAGEVYDYVTGERYTGRNEIWKASLKAAWDEPVLGSGPGTSVSRISRYVDTPWLKHQDTHSAYLKNAVEMGFPSVLVLMCFYVFFFYYAGRIEKKLKSRYLKQVTRGAMATVLGGIIYSFFENGFVMTAFDASSFVVIWPYAVMALPFAAKKLEEAAE